MLFFVYYYMMRGITYLVFKIADKLEEKRRKQESIMRAEEKRMETERKEEEIKERLKKKTKSLTAF